MQTGLIGKLSRRQLGNHVCRHLDRHRLIARHHLEANAAVVIADVEMSPVVLAGKEPSTGQVIEERAGIAARDVHPFVLAIRIAPHDRESVGCVLARQPEYLRKTARANPFEADEADATDRETRVQLRPERRRQLPLCDRRIDPEVDEQPPANDSVYAWKAHVPHASPVNRSPIQALWAFSSRAE
jgi:hypothetical protein